MWPERGQPVTVGPPGKPRQRRGWQIPSQQSTQDGAPRPSPQASPLTPEPGGPKPTLRGSVFGQVADVSEATLQTSRPFSTNQVTEPIVTLRLERNDPHAGRSFIANVRLNGGDAVGFADVGDWIEAVGKRKPAHLVATHCVNHTTGAEYGVRPVGLSATIVIAIVIVIVIVIVLAFVGMAVT